MRVAFVKMHGAGNDFVVIDRRPLTLGDGDLTAFVRAVCDRRRGVGADGVLFLEAAPDGFDFAMRYHNRDGGEAELCGNGGRCLAAFAVAHGFGADGRVRFVSAAGAHEARVEDGRVAIVLGDAEAPRLGLVLDTPVGTVEAAYVKVGVPHLVVEVPDVAAVDLAVLGPVLRAHPELGAEGANVDVAQVIAADRVRLRTFERGVEGETLACGTGAAATAIALVARGRVRAPVTLEVESGDALVVRFEQAEDGGGAVRSVTLVGPVVTSFEGTFDWQPPGGSARARTDR
jgi:diaminopimelate epimerase